MPRHETQSSCPAEADRAARAVHDPARGPLAALVAEPVLHGAHLHRLGPAGEDRAVAVLDPAGLRDDDGGDIVLPADVRAALPASCFRDRGPISSRRQGLFRPGVPGWERPVDRPVHRGELLPPADDLVAGRFVPGEEEAVGRSVLVGTDTAAAVGRSREFRPSRTWTGCRQLVRRLRENPRAGGTGGGRG